MKWKPFTITAEDGTPVTAYKWSQGLLKKPKAVVYIVHGMAEHALRYDDFAQYLLDNGFSVYSMDLRGHGKTAGTVEKLGFFAEADGWNRMVDDIRVLTRTGEKENPGLPAVLYGHSMGSILARCYFIKYGAGLAGFILSGIPARLGFLGPVGKMIASWEIARFGTRHPSTTLHGMNFGSYNKAFAPNRTDFDWLSRDEERVNAYRDDPFCGTVFSSSAYRDLLEGAMSLEKRGAFSAIDRNVPVYLFGGDRDSVSKFGKGLAQAEGTLRGAGVTDVTVKLYRDGRHEMLNETNRAEVYRDLLDWLSSRVSP